ncbi:Piso0_001868 [Millerozyma farinosa CBS 7064]|uniref:Piso0_001868 protein n=1 Tax=Pichia sorbitophila (strain ATCC MYA-4447 / BCRC 22081 / CBS 7064 / NBRC 10061 / NRRL Y-12695) TaxID=559304 RepID=G8YPB1_PICSO|nr:Piso0_001868 [Millerozyma farinosa CBS 7064]
MAYKRSYSSRRNDSGAAAQGGNDVVIELDKKKQVTVRKFNNINLVDIREFFEDRETNEKKPTKKGISLTEESWKKLVSSIGEIQDALDELKGVKPSKAQKLESSEESTKNNADKESKDEASLGRERQPAAATEQRKDGDGEDDEEEESDEDD